MKKTTAILSFRLLGLALLLIAVSGGGPIIAQSDDPCQRNCLDEWLQSADVAQDFYDDCMLSAGTNQSLMELCNLQTDAIILDAEVSFNSCVDAQQHCGCTGAGGAF